MSSEENIKDEVLTQLGDQIKALQLKQFESNENDGKKNLIKCNNIHLKCLFDVLDHILLYGLKNPDIGYWVFVCEFTHPEVKKQISEHSDVHSVFDKGRLWIYLALLDCLLGSYFRMFYENQKVPSKYYHRNSFIRDKERLAIIFTLVSGLDLIRLPSELDLSFLGFRDFGLTNVIANSSTKSQNGRKHGENIIPMQPFHTDRTEMTSVKNGHVEPKEEIVNATADHGKKDQSTTERTGSPDDVTPADDTDGGTGSKMSMTEGSYLDTIDWLSIKKPGMPEEGTSDHETRSEAGDSFDEFCHNNDRKSVDSNDVINDSTISIVEAEDEAVPIAPEPASNSVSVSEVSSSLAEYEGIVLAGFPRRPELSETLGTSADVSIKKSTIDELSLNIIEDNGETFHRLVKGFTGFKYGQLHCVYLLLTDKAIYFLRKQPNGSFSCESVVCFRDLKQIEIGLNCQSLAFVARTEGYLLSTANEAVTRSLISDISSLVVKCFASATQLTRLVTSAAVQGEAAIKQWLRHALKTQTLNMEVLCFSLVHWMCFSGPGSELDTVRYQIIKEGYLQCKSKYLGMVSHWEKNYMVLTGRGLYQYARQGDKTPQVIYKLSGSNCGGCRRVSDEDRKYSFEIISDDGSSLVAFSSSNEDQASDWIMKLCQTVAGSTDFLFSTLCPASRSIPCCLVVTKQNVVTFHAHINREYRFLSSFFIQDITQILVDNEVRNYCILKFEADHEGMWLFLFTTEYELSKFEHVIAEAWKDCLQADLQFYIIGEGPTRQRAREMCQYIKTTFFES